MAKMVRFQVDMPVKGGGKVGHWGDGMVDHREGASWLGGESWRQNQGMGADWVLSGLVVVWCVCRLGRGDLPAALEPVALAVHLQDVHVVGEAVQQRPGEPF